MPFAKTPDEPKLWMTLARTCCYGLRWEHLSMWSNVGNTRRYNPKNIVWNTQRFQAQIRPSQAPTLCHAEPRTNRLKIWDNYYRPPCLFHFFLGSLRRLAARAVVRVYTTMSTRSVQRYVDKVSHVLVSLPLSGLCSSFAVVVGSIPHIQDINDLI